jgi:putative ABC transport system ATP-binding protein
MNNYQTVVEARGVKKHYSMGRRKIEALRGVDISVKRKEFIAIMGPSGSGKTTLMNILGCLEKPTEGKHLLGGRDTSTLSDRELSHVRATQIGFVFQTFNLVPQYTVLENITMPFLYRKESNTVAKSMAEKAIERVGLSSRKKHKPSELSGGEMQRVAIARALAIDPILILADEPTGNLDSDTGKNIISLFCDLNEQGVTLIVVTHEKEVASYCRCLYQLRDGQFFDHNLPI